MEEAGSRQSRYKVICYSERMHFYANPHLISTVCLLSNCLLHKNSQTFIRVAEPSSLRLDYPRKFVQLLAIELHNGANVRKEEKQARKSIAYHIHKVTQIKKGHQMKIIGFVKKKNS